MFANPRRLFNTVATAEAVTWTLLLIGMFLKYVTETTDLGVRIFGMAHGVVFIGYGLITLLVWVDARWSLSRGMLALVAAIPPFATLLVERSVRQDNALPDHWRLTSQPARSPAERVAAWMLRNPVGGLVTGVVALVTLTAVALVIGPPTG